MTMENRPWARRAAALALVLSLAPATRAGAQVPGLPAPGSPGGSPGGGQGQARPALTPEEMRARMAARQEALKKAKDMGTLDPAMYDGSVDPDDPSLPNFSQILVNTDIRSSFYESDMSSRMTMINVSPERGTITRVNRIYRRDKEDLYLVITEEPASRRGQGTLRVGRNMWRYDPGSRKFHHTTLKDTYEESTARNSDFRRQQRSLDYEATSVLLGQLGQQKVFIADLQAVNDEVAFPYIRMWVTRDTQLVLKVEEYSLSKKLLRTSYYTDYLRIGTSMFPTRQIFVDGLVPEKRSQMQLAEISLEPIPDEYFTKDYLERKSR